MPRPSEEVAKGLHVATVRKHLRVLQAHGSLVVHRGVLQQHLAEARRQGLQVSYAPLEGNSECVVLCMDRPAEGDGQ